MFYLYFNFEKKKQLVKDVVYVNLFYMYYMIVIFKKFNKDKKNFCIFIFRYESYKGIYLMLLY